jgi:hypothetical protein
MLLRNTLGFWQRTESMMYMILTGMIDAIALVRIMEDEDQVNTSICPGMSITNRFLCSGYFFVIF